MNKARPPVVLLHGQPGSGADWAAVGAALTGRANAIALTRPGWDGRSEARDLAGNALAVLEALDERGIDRATIAGHSLGGAVAVWLAVHHPVRVAALVLAAPAANLASLTALDRWLARPLIGRQTGAALLALSGLCLAVTPVRGRIAERWGLDDAYLRASGRGLLRPHTWQAFHAEQRFLAAELPTLQGRLGEVMAPTWIVGGSRDRVVSPVAAQALSRQIAGARLVVLDGAGHLLPQLHARRLADAILVALDDAISD